MAVTVFNDIIKGVFCQCKQSSVDSKTLWDRQGQIQSREAVSLLYRLSNSNS